MCLDGERPKTHGSHHKVLHDVLHRLHHVKWYRITLEIKEIADEDRSILFIHKFGVLLELFVVACACGQLKRGDGLRIPSMLDAILAVVKLSVVRKKINVGRLGKCSIVQCDGIFGDGGKTDTTNG